jgi:hypothetical protein
MAPAVAAALVAGAVALITSLVSIVAGRRLADASRFQARQDVMRRYRDPLLRSAYDLQSRLWNIVCADFLERYFACGDETQRAYAVENTLFVVGEFLAWVEIVRQDIQFLDLGRERQTRALIDAIDEIRGAFSRDEIETEVFKIFRGQQRAIGEIMIREPSEPSESIGYAAFVQRLRDPAFRGWFDRLEADIAGPLVRDLTTSRERLTAIQHALMDLVDLLDQRAIYFQPRRRGKIPIPG